MPLLPAQVSVTTTATRLDSTANNDNTRAIALRNRGTVPVFIGDSNVTTSTGYQLDAGAFMRIDLRWGDGVWGVTASGAATVHRIQLGTT